MGRRLPEVLHSVDFLHRCGQGSAAPEQSRIEAIGVNPASSELQEAACRFRQGGEQPDASVDLGRSGTAFEPRERTIRGCNRSAASGTITGPAVRGYSGTQRLSGPVEKAPPLRVSGASSVRFLARKPAHDNRQAMLAPGAASVTAASIKHRSNRAARCAAPRKPAGVSFQGQPGGRVHEGERNKMPARMI